MKTTYITTLAAIALTFNTAFAQSNNQGTSNSQDALAMNDPSNEQDLEQAFLEAKMTPAEKPQVAPQATREDVFQKALMNEQTRTFENAYQQQENELTAAKAERNNKSASSKRK